MSENIEAKFSWIQPDHWQVGGAALFEADEYDKKFFGEDVIRIDTAHTHIASLPVKIKITGKKVVRYDHAGNAGLRCRIEFCKDGEPSEYSGGVVFIKKAIWFQMNREASEKGV